MCLGTSWKIRVLVFDVSSQKLQENPIWGSLAFHLWNQWVFSIDFSKFCMNLGLIKWRFLLPEPARWASFCTHFHSDDFAAMHLVLHHAADVVWLIEDWDHLGRTSTGVSQIPNGAAELVGALYLYFRAAESVRAVGRNPGMLGGSWCHCEVTVSSQRSWTLEKLVYDWKNANSSWKGEQDKPLRACSHLASEEQQSAKPNMVWLKFFQSSQSGAFSAWLVWAIFPWFWRGREIKCQNWLLTVTLSFFKSTDQ